MSESTSAFMSFKMINEMGKVNFSKRVEAKLLGMQCYERGRYVYSGQHVLRETGSKELVLGVSAALEKRLGA